MSDTKNGAKSRPTTVELTEGASWQIHKRAVGSATVKTIRPTAGPSCNE